MGAASMSTITRSDANEKLLRPMLDCGLPSLPLRPAAVERRRAAR